MRVSIWQFSCFPGLNENFTVVDDLDSPRNLPPFSDVQTMAERQNPDLRVAEATLREADLDIRIAREAFLPAFAIDAHYGIEANAFALHSTVAANPRRDCCRISVISSRLISMCRSGIGGSAEARFARLRPDRNSAQTQLTQAQRQIAANLYAFYNEAVAAREAVDGLRRVADLAAESLQLVELRYGAGESTALEVVDAQKTLVDARNAYDDAQTRYRVAISTLQTLTGSF